MKHHKKILPGAMLGLGLLILGTVSGCGPSFHQLRVWGQERVSEGRWAGARQLFHEAYEKVPEDAENLHDLGVVSLMLARQQAEEGQPAAARRELDRAINYYNRAIESYPGFRSAIIGKNRALELKGQFEDALQTARWAATYVGPSAEQEIFLAREYEERGDLDAALLRLEQGVAMEPNNPRAHAALGLFQYRHGREAEAANHLRRAYQLDPGQKDVVNAMLEMGVALPRVRTETDRSRNAAPRNAPRPRVEYRPERQ